MDLQPEKKFPIWVFLLLTILIIGIAGGVWWLLLGRSSTSSQVSTQLPTARPALTATPTTSSANTVLDDVANTANSAANDLTQSISEINSTATNSDTAPTL